MSKYRGRYHSPNYGAVITTNVGQLNLGNQSVVRMLEIDDKVELQMQLGNLHNYFATKIKIMKYDYLVDL